MAKIIMVVGLLFSGIAQQETGGLTGQILLLQKNRAKNYEGDGHPEWMKGKYNGVGGVVQIGESPIDCLIRKTSAECGIDTIPAQWKKFHEISNDGCTIMFAKAHISPANISKASSPTTEAVTLMHLERLGNQPLVSNLMWLIYMALDERHNFSLSCDMNMPSYQGISDVHGTSWIDVLKTQEQIEAEYEARMGGGDNKVLSTGDGAALLASDVLNSTNNTINTLAAGSVIEGDKKEEGEGLSGNANTAAKTTAVNTDTEPAGLPSAYTGQGYSGTGSTPATEAAPKGAKKA